MNGRLLLLGCALAIGGALALGSMLAAWYPSDPTPEPAATAEARFPAQWNLQGTTGSTLATDPSGEVLYLADSDAGVLWSLPLAATTGAPPGPGGVWPEARAYPLPGRSGQLLALGSSVLVAISNPSMLLLLERRDDGELGEAGRVVLPEGAWGLAADHDASVVLVTCQAAAQLVAVQLQPKMKIRWSASVPSDPRQVVMHPAGTGAFVSHLFGGQLTVLDSLVGPPTITERPTAAAELGGPLALSPDGTRLLVAHQLRSRSEEPAAGALVALGIDDAHYRAPVRAAAGARLELPLARGFHSLRVRGRLLVAAGEQLVELDAQARPMKATAEHDVSACADVRGLTTAPAGSRAYLSCGSGHVAAVTLSAEQRQRGHSLRLWKLPSLEPRREPLRCAASPGTAPLIPLGHRPPRDPRGVARVLRQFHCRYPDLTELFEIGTTHQDRPLFALQIGRHVTSRHHRPTIFLNGGHHGDETPSISIVMDAIATLLERDEEAVRAILDEVVIVAVPLVNPDGRMAMEYKQGGRKNGRDNDGDGLREWNEGVDLNRNYPFRWHTLGEKGSQSRPGFPWYRGPSPASEPETQAVMRLANSEHFVGSISYHTGTLAVLYPYTIPGVRDPKPNVPFLVARHIHSKLPWHPQGPMRLERRLYPIDGCDQDWHRHEHGTVALLVEGAEAGIPSLLALPGTLAANRVSWLEFAKRFVHGPALGGHVRDAAGQPVQAVVSIAEIETREGERWSSRCRDGRFDRYLPGPGNYTVVAELPGLKPIRQRVEVGQERAEIELRVPVVVTRPAQCPTATKAAGQPAVWRALE